MRIIVNELQMLKQRTGIGHYTAELRRCLRTQLAGDERIDGFPGGLVRRAVTAGFRAGRGTAAQSSGGPPSLRAALVGTLRAGCQKLLDQRFARTCRAGRYDLYHEPNYLPMPADCPTLATWHDLSVLLHPQWHPADRVQRFEQQLGATLGRCTHLLADTDSVRREIIDLLGVPGSRVTRVHMGIRPDLRPLAADDVARGLNFLGLPQRYLLCLGTIEPRKNVLRLLQAYCTLPDAVRQRWPLLLVGGWGWNAAEIRTYLHDVAQHRGVRHLGYVADEYLPILYNGARALVFPSFYEGFGLPPLEMLACGGAVVASTAAAVREVVGGHAYLLEPENTDGWREAMLRVVKDDDWWRLLRQGAVEAARPFTWERCAAETLAVYRQVSRRASQPLPQRAVG